MAPKYHLTKAGPFSSACNCLCLLVLAPVNNIGYDLTKLFDSVKLLAEECFKL